MKSLFIMPHQTKRRQLPAKIKASLLLKLHSTLLTKSLSHWRFTSFSKQSGSTENPFISGQGWMRSGKMACTQIINRCGRCWQRSWLIPTAKRKLGTTKSSHQVSTLIFLSSFYPAATLLPKASSISPQRRYMKKTIQRQRRTWICADLTMWDICRLRSNSKISLYLLTSMCPNKIMKKSNSVSKTFRRGSNVLTLLKRDVRQWKMQWNLKLL